MNGNSSITCFRERASIRRDVGIELSSYDIEVGAKEFSGCYRGREGLGVVGGNEGGWREVCIVDCVDEPLVLEVCPYAWERDFGGYGEVVEDTV